MQITAQLVKQLRDETGAPMGECRQALVEAAGDFERAKTILREKGAAAAAKRADRATSEGVVAISVTPDAKKAGVAVLEAETDFVAKNPDFIALAQRIADAFRDCPCTDGSCAGDPDSVDTGGTTVGALVEGAVATIRENIRLGRSACMRTDGAIATYVHHDRRHGALVEVAEGADALEAGRKVAIQIVAMRPAYLNKDEIPQEDIDKEIEIETQRALNEGKPETVARNIAQGRVNKEFVQAHVLMEQPFFEDGRKTVGQWLKEQGGVTVKSFLRVSVGA
jgi:elongation factor Ts